MTEENISLGLIEEDTIQKGTTIAPLRDQDQTIISMASFDKRTLFDWVRVSPEAFGVATAICDDLLGEGFDLVGSKLAVKRAEEFCEDVNFTSKFYSALLDMVITGDGFIFKENVSKEQVMQQITNCMSNYNISKDIISVNGLGDAIYKARYTIPKDLKPLSSIYMNLIVKNNEIIGYQQSRTATNSGVIIDSTTNLNDNNIDAGNWSPVGSEGTVSFKPDEIVHLSINNIGGQKYGFTPFRAALNDIATLWLAKDYAGKFFENDASPNRIWILKNGTPNSPQYKEFEKMLKSYKKAKHSHMLITGDVVTEKINDFNKDLEFQNLIRELTQRIMLAWSMPASRIKYYAVGSDRMPMESNEGYYKKINLMQSMMEEILNPQLFSTFGDVKFIFRRAYKRDESREADIVAKLVGRPVMTINEARVLLGKLPIDKAEYDEIPKSAVGFNPSGANTPKQPKSTEETAEINSKAPDERNEGIVNRIFKSIGGLIGKNNVEKSQFLVVPYDKFVTIIESTGYGIHNAKVFYNENESKFELYFSDGVFAYKTVVDKATLPDIEGFRVSNLSNAIPAKTESSVEVIIQER